MLLFCPKVSVSQQVVIDTINQTTLLDRDKTIEVGKIIQNEQALYEENELLRGAVSTLQQALKRSEQQITLYRDKFSEAQQEIIKLQSGVIDDTDKLLDLERDYSSKGIYAYGEIGTSTTTQDYRHLFLGAKWVRSKTIYSFSINPVNANPIYAVGFGFKIF